MGEEPPDNAVRINIVSYSDPPSTWMEYPDETSEDEYRRLVAAWRRWLYLDPEARLLAEMENARPGPKQIRMEFEYDGQRLNLLAHG